MKYSKEEFLKDVSNQNNHRYLLWEALEKTNGPIVEMGMGYGSTPYLHEYAVTNNRQLFSYETNLDWLKKFLHLDCKIHSVNFVNDWNEIYKRIPDKISVVLVDHAPGERRKEDLILLKNISEYIVAHDTEPAADHGYQMRSILSEFKYKKDYKTEGAWATIVSEKKEI